MLCTREGDKKSLEAGQQNHRKSRICVARCGLFSQLCAQHQRDLRMVKKCCLDRQKYFALKSHSGGCTWLKTVSFGLWKQQGCSWAVSDRVTGYILRSSRLFEPLDKPEGCCKLKGWSLRKEIRTGLCDADWGGRLNLNIRYLFKEIPSMENPLVLSELTASRGEKKKQKRKFAKEGFFAGFPSISWESLICSWWRKWGKVQRLTSVPRCLFPSRDFFLIELLLY